MKRSSDNRPPCTHMAGEFFVAAELSRRGFNVAMTMGNAKRVDLIIEDDASTCAIQVKAIAGRSGWPLSIDTSKIKNSLIYVFVILNKKRQCPDYFIMKGSDVKRLGNFYGTRAVLLCGKAENYRERWDIIESTIS
jgi:hypothetical protein